MNTTEHPNAARLAGPAREACRAAHVGRPTVRLVSSTESVLGTLEAVWEASRHNGAVRDPVEYEDGLATDWAVTQRARDNEALVRKIIAAKIPVAEMVDFVFLIEGVSISWREQAVRHRIGVKVDGRLGADTVPDLSDSTWWSQSMRILDMGKFVDAGRFRIPDSILTHQNPGVLEAYVRHLQATQECYRYLAANDVPLEDAREVVPLAATHRLVWKLNLSSLMHIIGKRGCWILQLGVWEPIIRGMVEELSSKVSPVFRDLIAPPCVEGDKFKGCLFKLDNERRVEGEDEIPPCPLFLNHHRDDAVRVVHQLTVEGKPCKVYYNEGRWETRDLAHANRTHAMRRDYGQLWRRNVDTGKRD